MGLSWVSQVVSDNAREEERERCLGIVRAMAKACRERHEPVAAKVVEKIAELIADGSVCVEDEETE